MVRNQLNQQDRQRRLDALKAGLCLWKDSDDFDEDYVERLRAEWDARLPQTPTRGPRRRDGAEEADLD